MNAHRAEKAVLGGVLICPDKFADIADKVTVDDFQDEANRIFWNALVSLDQSNKPLDLVSVCTEIGQWDYAKELFDNTPSAANIEHYAGLVRDAALERRLLVAGSEVMAIAKSKGDIREKLDEATSKLMAVTESRADSGPKAVREYLPAWIDTLESRFQNAGEIIGASTGLDDLDKLTAGLQDTDLIIVAGRPSMGKTTLAMNFAESVGVQTKSPVLVFSMEMGAEQLITRSVSSLGMINNTNLRLGSLEDADWPRVTSAMALINDSGLIIDETPALTVLELRARARRAHRKTPLKMIVVDYIQLMDGRGENRTNIVSDISRGLKALAKELRVPVVALSQLNRSLEKRVDKRPILSDLRESGAIEQDADLIMFVYRDEVYNEDTPNKGVAEIIVGKQRNGSIGKVLAAFQGEYCRFKNFIGDIYEDQPTANWKGGFSG